MIQNNFQYHDCNYLRYFVFFLKFLFLFFHIFLHDKKEWRGPKFLYPISEYNFDGIKWDSPLGFTITLTIIIILFNLNDNQKNKFIHKFYLPGY